MVVFSWNLVSPRLTLSLFLDVLAENGYGGGVLVLFYFLFVSLAPISNKQ